MCRNLYYFCAKSMHVYKIPFVRPLDSYESVRCIICIANTLNFESSLRKKPTCTLLVYSTIFSYFYYVHYWLITQRSRALLPRCVHVPCFATIIITPFLPFTNITILALLIATIKKMLTCHVNIILKFWYAHAPKANM